LIGETLGQKYEIVRLLGQGGMGAVYEAKHRETRERVAVKVLHSHLLEPGGDGQRRFRREAETARAIRGEHVVRVLDAGTDEATGQLYLVTEYLDGEDLQRLFDRLGPLPPEVALRLAAQTLAGLCEAHEARVVHRDIKPANILLARGPGGALTVKILDFGIAKIRNDSLGLSLAAGPTTTGGFLGSPLYMSPEQIQSSRDVDHRTDVWSLGCVLYAALAGRAPHEHLTSVGQILVAICVSPPPPLSEVAPWISPEIAEIVRTALEIRVDARYPSAAAMLGAIRTLVPSDALTQAMLVPISERPREVDMSTIPPSPALASPRVVVVPSLGGAARGDAPTDHAGRAGHAAERAPGAWSKSADTLPSGLGEARGVARSGVPVIGVKAGARVVTVDPRRILGEESEMWTFSLDVHRHVSSLVARIWKSLRRAGAKVPPMTYGTAWALVDPRTGQAIVAPQGEGAERVSLEAAGIRPGTVLWVVPSDAVPRAS
jgi:eukaryotic-like serine/threonine-protein kinase